SSSCCGRRPPLLSSRWSAAPPDPRSCPTRRSSDLNAIVLVRDESAIGMGAGQMSRVDSSFLAAHKARQQGHDPRGAVLASDAFLDRKSTRLNSSHLVISYAVFCLKKKIIMRDCALC